MCAHPPEVLKGPQNSTELLPKLKCALGSIKGLDAAGLLTEHFIYRVGMALWHLSLVERFRPTLRTIYAFLTHYK